jgi:acetyl esterase/lipase
MGFEDTLDPEVAALMAAVPITSIDIGAVGLSGIPDLRAAIAAMPRPQLAPRPVEQRDHVVPGAAGEPDVPVRVFRPAGADGSLPCIYWIHGGGYIFGSALVDDPRLPRWAEELGCVVVSVEYRLAPEHPYPAPLEDCYTGLVWTFRQAAGLGIDPRRVAIAGASAGGGLAAGLALLARDRAEVAPVYQLLIYPMIDDRNVTTSSWLAPPVWSRQANLLGWQAYLGPYSGRDDVPGYAAPARATELSGLPPAFVAVGTLDVFRDEDIDYALRLLGAEVPTELHVYPGAPHGFEAMAPTAAVARRCHRDIDNALRSALGSISPASR